MTGTENRVEAIPIHAGEGLPLEILLVEDSPSDVAMTVAALQEGRIAIDLHVVGDGEDALAFLRRAPGYEDAPRPDMVFLDLNLPARMAARSSTSSRTTLTSPPSPSLS